MLFPKFHIDEIKKQEGRDLTRFDLDFDLPDHFLPEFPPPIFLTTRPDLGDVSQGKLVTIDELLRAVQRHPQSRSSSKACGCWSRRSRSSSSTRPTIAAPRSRAAASPASTATSTATPTRATHLVGRHPAAGVPPPHRHAVAARREHPAAVRLAARAEDGRGLHRVRAARRLLRRRPGDRHQEGRQHPRARQPGPLHGRVPGAARLPAGAEARRVRQARSRARPPPPSCAARSCSSARPSASTCHPPPYYTDNPMHNLQAERFFKPQMINGRMAIGRRPDQDLPAARHQGFAAVPARRPAADARRHRRVLQPGARHEAHRAGEEGPGAFLRAL